MKLKKLLPIIILSAYLLFTSGCNNPGNTAEKKGASQTPANDSTTAANTSILKPDSNNQAPDNSVQNEDTSAPSLNADSMLSSLKGFTSLLGKNDSGILKNLNGGGSIDSMMKKLQSMTGGKSSNPGDAIGNKLLNLQLGQMSDDNPLKSVANGMMTAQQNGTAGPSQTYTATYKEEQPADYNIPISGNGNTIMLQYTGGSIANNKKDGFWKNIYVSTNKEAVWNIYSEAYAESSAINMKLHATSLASTKENYSIILNDQYKKYAKQSKSDLGKNESGVLVQKIGNGKMFGYNCVHIRVSYTIKAMGQTAQMQEDEWYSADVPGSQFLSPVIFEVHSPAVVKKIMDAGCSGVMIKFISKSKGSIQQLQLSSITKKDMPDSLFTLPANYQEDKNTVLYGMQ